MNKDELSSTLGIHKNTLDNYLFYLEQTFILDLVRPFYSNPRKELIKSPKVYFCDPGIRNFAIAGFSDFDFRPDKGGLFENISYLWLKGKAGSSMPIHFWRTKAGAEVDFVMVRGMSTIPLEVKASGLKKPKISKSLRSFLKSYQPPKAYCMNLSLRGLEKIESTTVFFVTPADYAKLNFE